MPASTHKRLKARGTRFEYRVRDYLKSLGFTVFRSAGSHTAADLVAIQAGPDVLVVQCKAMEEPTISRTEKADLLHYKRCLGCRPVVVCRDAEHALHFYTFGPKGQLTEVEQLWIQSPSTRQR